MEEVLIGSVMFSFVLQIQTFFDTEIMLHCKHKNYAQIGGRLTLCFVMVPCQCFGRVLLHTIFLYGGL